MSVLIFNRIVNGSFKVWQVHNPSAYGVFVIATSAARAAELLVAQCPFSLITSPALPAALTTHNLVAYHLPSCRLWRLRHYQLTGRRQLMTAAGGIWAGPLFKLKLLIHVSPHQAFRFSLVSGSQVLKRRGKGQRICLVVTATFDNIRCQESWSTITEAGWELCSASLFFLESRGSRTEGESTIFC